MHVQPGSSHRRGVLTVAEHARLRSAARTGSLVATRTHRRATEVIDARLDSLGALERQGYVNVGERAWLDELNDEQRAAATHAGGHLLILAGAGTGKTTTLCARVAWLVSSGVPSERILLLTFTRRASTANVAACP